jgi:capsular polysaccharide biosynthesis protein
LGVFFGLVLSIGTVLLSEMSDRRIRGGKELEELLTGVPLLGRIAAIGPQDMIATTAPAGLLRFEP